MIADCGLGRKPDNDSVLPRTGNGERGDYHEWRLSVSDALRDAGHENDADAFWDCAADNASFSASHSFSLPEKSNIVRVYVCEAHGVKVVRKTCHLRVCPDCAKREANRHLAKYEPVFEDLLHQHHDCFRFRKIVLTTPLSLHDPDIVEKYREFRNSIPDMFDALLPNNWRKNQGFIVSDEFGPCGEKLHFHILFFGQWIDNKERNGFPLSSAWRKVTGGQCQVVYIGGVDAKDLIGELIETLKYVCKFWKTDPDTGEVVRLAPEHVVTLHSLLKRQRRVRSYGIFNRVPAPPDRPPTCPDCGEEMHRWTVIQYNIWLSTGWTPEIQSLNLRTGNKSPPKRGSGGGDLVKMDTPGNPQPVQTLLSHAFGRINHDLP